MNFILFIHSEIVNYKCSFIFEATFDGELEFRLIFYQWMDYKNPSMNWVKLCFEAVRDKRG